MKTGEMLIPENVGKIFLRKVNNRKYTIHKNGTLYDQDGNYGIEGVNVHEDWELVREPVYFMAAVNSGKNIRPLGCKDNFEMWNYWTLSLERVNGQWELES